MGDDRLGKKSYIRTEEHRKKMSDIIKNHPVAEKQRKRFSEMNSSRKGKTIEEIFGADKAEEIRKKHSRFGKDNHNWKGGKSFLPYSYEFNIEKKLTIKDRDGYICLLCGVEENIVRDEDTLNRGLTIHHIDYDRNNCDNNNLITLCKRCNSIANGDRDFWTKYYREVLLCLV
jgi:5-methylcytosine-specific restriction endonuclease McrA